PNLQEMSARYRPTLRCQRFASALQYRTTKSQPGRRLRNVLQDILFLRHPLGRDRGLRPWSYGLRERDNPPDVRFLNRRLELLTRGSQGHQWLVPGRPYLCLRPPCGPSVPRNVSNAWGTAWLHAIYLCLVVRRVLMRLIGIMRSSRRGQKQNLR